MNFTRRFAALGLALAAFGSVAPDASAGSPVCRECVLEGVARGSGIVPDPTKLRLNFDVLVYSTDPLAVPVMRQVSFDGTITAGDPNKGYFKAEGSVTSTIPVGDSVFLYPFTGYGYVESLSGIANNVRFRLTSQSYFGNRSMSVDLTPVSTRLSGAANPWKSQVTGGTPIVGLLKLR